MTSAFAGTYSDLKFVKSRKVAQVVIEMPIEDANRFLSAFGAPDPASEVWCAIARLNHAPETHHADEPEKPRRPWDTLRPSARAAMLCNETAFQAYIKVQSADQAAQKVRRHCGIESRRELDTDETKRMKFEMVERDFQRWREEKHF